MAASPKSECQSANAKEGQETGRQKYLPIISGVKDRALGCIAEMFIKEPEVDRATMRYAAHERDYLSKANCTIEHQVNYTR